MKTKIVIFVILTLSLMLSLCISIFAHPSDVISCNEFITDKGNLVSDSDEIEISDALRAAKERCGADVRAYVYQGEYYYGWENYVSESEYKFDSLVLLVIQYDKWDSAYYYYIDTYGVAEYDVNDNEINRILDNPEVYNNIKSGNLKDGIIAYANLSATAVVGKLRPNFVKVLITSLILAAVAATAVGLSIYFSYKKKLHSESYPLGKYASLNLQIQRDSFITRFVTTVRIRSSNGGSRSGGRSGGGFGGRSGGSRRGGR